MDFLHIVEVYGVIIQAQYQSQNRVIEVWLHYSDDGKTWTIMSDLDGQRKVLVKMEVSVVLRPMFSEIRINYRSPVF